MRLSRLRAFASVLWVGISSLGVAAPNGYTWFWGDEFNLGPGKQASVKNWAYNLGNSGWGNNELEDYTNFFANSHIVADANATDGLALQIQAIESAPGVYTSARLLSQGLVNVKYGYIEARIRMPYGQGIWPAFWMLGSNINSVGWPACGETDIMENIGSVPNTNWGSLHAPSFNPSVTYSLSSPNVFHSAYHLFQASWTPNALTFYVDGIPYHSENINNDASWPFNEPMFFIMNVAVGGNWPGSPDSTTVFPQNLLVDYVRVYHLTGPASNEVVSLFSSANNYFVSAESGGASPLDCDRTTALTWEQFLVVDLGSNQVALQSQANGKFVTLTSSSSPTLIADSSKITVWSKFQWVPNPDGTVYLKCLANNKYLTVDTTQNPPAVVATEAIPKAGDAFGVTCYSQLAAPTAPTPPRTITAKGGFNLVSTTWSACYGADSYELYRSTLPGGSGMAPLAAVKGTSYTDTGLSSDSSYSYSVSALNAQGMSLRSAIATAKPVKGTP